MKKFIYSLSVILILAGCGSNDHGELMGVDDREQWYPSDPYGMVYIPMGNFRMGLNEQDVPYSLTAPTKSVSVAAFYMDATEITNNEYRQFVHWVRDSIFRTKLADADQFEDYRYKYNQLSSDVRQGSGEAVWNQYMYDNYDAQSGAKDPYEYQLSWEEDLVWDHIKAASMNNGAEYLEVLEEMYIPIDERFYGRREVDARNLMYRYYWIDHQKAAKSSNRYDFDNEKYDSEDITDRSDFIVDENLNIFPDTLAWIHDYTYSFNDPWHDKYFWHPAYDEYPVVGVNWNQAKAFCNWRSRYRDSYLEYEERPYETEFRLPTEAEWEYAARGGINGGMYPWGGPYIRNSQGCFLGNFKPTRGNYVDDGGFHTVKTTSYWPNDFGLYCMAGNVSEWTSTAFDPQSYSFSHDLQPNFEYNAKDSDPHVLKRKVIRGGSWKDIGMYLQVSTRDYEYQDTSKCYIGFRTVQTFLGRDLKDFN